MKGHKLEAVSASKIYTFEQCIDEDHYLAEYSPIDIPVEKNNKRYLGIISHEILSNFLKGSMTTIDRNSTEKLFLDIIKKNNYYFDDNYLIKREGTEFIYRNIKVLNNLKNFIEKNNLSTTSELTYPTSPPFYGQADIVLRDNNQSIIIDYKTGKVYDEGKNISKTIQRQLMAYCYLELINNNQNLSISAFVLNKEGSLLPVDDCNRENIDGYKNKILKNIDEFNNQYQKIHSSSFYCNECKQTWVGRFTDI